MKKEQQNKHGNYSWKSKVRKIYRECTKYKLPLNLAPFCDGEGFQESNNASKICELCGEF